MRNDESYYRLAQMALEGIQRFQTALPLTHVTVATYQPIYSDAKARAQTFKNLRRAKANAFAVLRDRRTEADTFLTNGRNYLTGFLGDTWSPAWIPLGFEDNSLRLSNRDAGRCQMLDKFKLYFAQNPAQENASKDFTSARADALCSGLVGALASVRNCKFETRVARDARDAADAKLDKELAKLRKELDTVLDPLDPRWLIFVDRIPGDLRVPEPVENIVTRVESGRATLDWDDPSRAARFKVFKQVIGVDPAPTLLATVRESELEVPNLPSGSRVQFQITATNGVGDAPPSPVVELLAP